MNGTVVLPIHEYSLPYHKTAGCLLREARELKGLSQEAVASSLNLMLSHVVAMESDAYNPHIEGKHFASYLKSYARLVELNPQILLGLYQGQSVVPAQNYVLDQPIKSKRQGSGTGLRIVTIAALLGVALVFTRQGIDVQQFAYKAQQKLVEFAQAGTLAAKSSYANLEKEVESVAATGADSTPQAESAWRTPQWAKESEAVASVEKEQAPEEAHHEASNWESSRSSRSSQQMVSNPVAPSNIVVTPSDATYQAYRLDVLEESLSATTKEDVLEFTFVGNCWIEVYDSNQNPIIMETKLEGELLTISGEAPFEVRVGNSRAVSLQLNGEPVHIEQHPTIDSTELIVGRR